MTRLALLHRAPDRQETYASLAPLSWSDDLTAFVSADPEVMRQALRTPELAVIDFRLIHQALAERFRIDFSPSVCVLDHVALGLNGAEHQAARRSQTLYIKSITPGAIAAFDRQLAADVARLGQGGAQLCLAQDLILPAVEAMFEVMSGFAISDDRDPSLSLIFDRMLSVNRRKRVNERLRALMGDRPDGAEVEAHLMRIALSIVGADSLFGTLTESLRCLLAEQEGVPLNQIDWPAAIPATAVPYVDRIASADTVLAGQQIEKGQRVRLYLEALQRPGAGAAAEVFGIGRHVCLGKALSMQAWTLLVARLSALPCRLQLLEHRYRRNDYLFNAAETVLVEVRHG